MVKSESFYTLESALSMISKLRDAGKRFTVDGMTDYDACENMPIAYFVISWIED